jgi:hypothetical protein
VLAGALADMRAVRVSGGSFRLAISLALAVTILLQATTSTTAWEVLGFRHGAKIAQVYGAYMWGELLLLASTVWLLRRREPAPLACSGSTQLSFSNAEQGRRVEMVARSFHRASASKKRKKAV